LGKEFLLLEIDFKEKMSLMIFLFFAILEMDIQLFIHGTLEKLPKKKKIFVSMPGVPFEMKAMMENYVLKQLPGHFTLPHIAHRTLLTAGVGESFLAEKIIGFEEALPPHIKLAYLPSFGMVRLRISTSGHDKDIIEKELDILFSELQLLVKEYLVTNKDEPLQNVVANLLMYQH
jgi:nicotinamide-nucleotide amidase